VNRKYRGGVHADSLRACRSETGASTRHGHPFSVGRRVVASVPAVCCWRDRSLSAVAGGVGVVVGGVNGVDASVGGLSSTLGLMVRCVRSAGCVRCVWAVSSAVGGGGVPCG